MHCRYCRVWNEEDERRCVRCGRRLRLDVPQGGSDAYPLSTATAPAFEMLQGGEPAASAPAENITYQPSLFRDAAGGAKVIPIPMLTPTHPSGRPSGRDDAPAPRRVPSRPATPRSGSRRNSDSQQSLDFYDPQGGSRAMGMQVEAVIYCDAPVALPVHRMIAAVIDASLVLVAAGLFLAIFFLSGGILAITRQNAPFFLSIALVLALFYRCLWCAVGCDTPGMRFAGLKLVDFDGRTPDREQRAMRQVASLLSVLSAGLGLVWALVDEENLTWHDHISKTFPTPGQ
jgi:uncharacterized RDD family membrane protein YckC